MLLLKTKKLFYRKYPYKITMKIEGGRLIPHFGVNTVKRFCQAGPDYDGPVRFFRKQIDKKNLYDFAVAIEPFMRDKPKIRIERDTFAIFCDDEVLLDKLKKSMVKWITSVTEPSTPEELKFLREQGHKKILCKKYPHGIYQYKIQLSMRLNAKLRENFYKWSLNYKEKINFSKSTASWLKCETHTWYDRHAYLVDQKMLSMALLYLGDHCKKIEEFIIDDSINS